MRTVDPRVEERGHAMAARYAEGFTLKAVAHEFGTSPSNVSDWVRKLGLSRAPHFGLTHAAAAERGRAMAARYREGLSLRAVATEFGVSFPTVLRQIRRAGEDLRTRGRPMVFKPYDVLVRLLHGEKRGTIERTLGMTQNTIYTCLRVRDFSIDDLPRYRCVLDMPPDALAAFRAALEEDGLSYPDALEVAEEYQPSRRAA